MRTVEFPAVQERYYEEILPNGLTVRVLPKPDFAKSYAVLAVNYGSMDTEFVLDGETHRTPAGVAHYLEHKMFDLPDGNAMADFARFGGRDNAFTGYEMTAYLVEATEHLEENLRLLLEMVFTPYFTGESVEKERGIITEEIRMYADNAYSQVFERLYAAMFPGHPAAISIAGSVESIQQITADTLRECYDAFYRPANMLLCVAGRLAPEDVVRIARECTPAEKRPCAEKRAVRAEKQTNLPPVEKEMDVSIPTFAVGVRLPDLAPEDAATEYAAELAAELVCGEASKCYQTLYQNGLIDASFFSGFESVRELAMLSFGGDSEAPAAVQEAVLASAEHLRQTGVDPVELARLKRSMLGRKLRELDSFSGTCNRICGCFFDGVEHLRFRELLDAVTETDILQVLSHFTRENACMSVIYPRAADE